MKVKKMMLPKIILPLIPCSITVFKIVGINSMGANKLRYKLKFVNFEDNLMLFMQYNFLRI